MNTNKVAIQLSYPLFQEGTLGLASLPEGVPDSVTKDTFVNLSENAKELMMTALRRLELIDHEGNVEDELRELANSYSVEKWNRQMSNLLVKHYPKELEILKTGTPEQLAESIASNYTGSRKNKAVRFLAMAAADIGYIVSSKFADSFQLTNSTAKRLPKDAEISTCKPHARQQGVQDQTDVLAVSLNRGGNSVGTIFIPSSVDIADATLMNAILDAAGIFAERQEQKKGGEQ